MNLREILTFAPLVAAAFWIGLFPSPLMKIMDAPVAKLVEQVQPGYFKAEALAVKQAEAATLGMKGMQAPAEHHEGAPAGHGEAAPEQAAPAEHGHGGGH